jgi:chitinase
LLQVERAPASLVVTATSSNQTVVPNSGLVVSAGGTSRTLTVTPAANQSGAATITVTVGDGSGGLTSTSFVATVATGLSIADATMVEGNSGTKEARFTVSLTGETALPARVNFATVDGTAKAGTDYIALAGQLVFAPGEKTKIIPVIVNGEMIAEYHLWYGSAAAMMIPEVHEKIAK